MTEMAQSEVDWEGCSVERAGKGEVRVMVRVVGWVEAVAVAVAC